ncbi:class I adenylate-forming enzyme family protein [Deferrisoma palaeochoriense]
MPQQPFPASTYDHLEGLTVWAALRRSAERRAAKECLVDGDTRLTYRALVDGVESLARGLQQLGVRRGDMAAIYMKNSVELVLAFYALQKLGASVAWINPNYRENELTFILTDAGARWLFSWDAWNGFDYLELIRAILPRTPALERVIVAGAARDLPRGDEWVRFSELAARGAVVADAPLGPDDLCMLLYTSGTTGKPKGAMISQAQAVRGGWSYSLGVDATEDDTFLGFLPMTHSYGCGAILIQPYLLGARVVLLDAFSPRRAFEWIEQEKVTLQLAAPAHYIMELRDREPGRDRLDSVRAGLIAGQIAPEGLIRRVQTEMGVYISSFLGASEVGPGLSFILPYQTPLEVRERVVGYPIPGTEAKVVDPATGEECPPGEQGELLLKGWHVTRGYWNRPDETANQIRDGWLHTGDVGRFDGEGRFAILGRIKEWINRGGFKILPSEIEVHLVHHPAVEEVAVVSTPNPVLGESICACIRVALGAEPPTLEAIREFLKDRVAPFKLPDELLILDEFPRLGGGLKLKRFGEGGLAQIAARATNKQTRVG